MALIDPAPIDIRIKELICNTEGDNVKLTKNTYDSYSAILVYEIVALSSLSKYLVRLLFFISIRYLYQDSYIEGVSWRILDLS